MLFPLYQLNRQAMFPPITAVEKKLIRSTADRLTKSSFFRSLIMDYDKSGTKDKPRAIERSKGNR